VVPKVFVQPSEPVSHLLSHFLILGQLTDDGARRGDEVSQAKNQEDD